jgi:tRNA-uridine 2-sulfurtransferase
MTVRSRVVLAMSGGVDSSVAAHLLLQQGHEVLGVFMRHGEETVACDRDASPSLPIVDLQQANRQGCCTAQDALDARRVADRLGIPFYVLNLRAEFGRIIDYFVDEYSQGRTPNPCVVCNTWLKFGKLFDYADQLGASHVATGHSARIASGTADAARKTPRLLRGHDADKDQSYVLFGVARDLLPRMLLPVGGFQKSEIRAMALELGLRVAEKKDSQEICFVRPGEHAAFVRNRRGANDASGEIVTTDGQCVGRHEGIEGFTIGQRKGLGVALGEPRFVVAIDAATRRVIIGRHEELGRRELTANRLNWLTEPPTAARRCLAQICYNSCPQPAVAEPLPDGRLRVVFDQPCYGVAPGQAVVCYDDDQVLGGGWIESTCGE